MHSLCPGFDYITVIHGSVSFLLSIWIILSRYIKAVIADSVVNYADVGWKIRGTLRAVGIKEEKGVVNSRQPASAHCPIDDSVMLVGRIHIRDILGIINVSYRSLHTYELPSLCQNVPDISSLADPGKFSVRDRGTIHNNRRDRSHSILTFSAGFALDEPCEEFPRIVLIKSHRRHLD